MTFAQLTEYPELYGKVYWGCFRADKNDDKPAIISARNWFAARYDLVKLHSSNSAWNLMAHRGFDHNESYKTGSGTIVCVTSPYHVHELPFWFERFFKLTRKLYTENAESFMAQFKNVSEIRKAVKEIERLNQNQKLEHAPASERTA